MKENTLEKRIITIINRYFIYFIVLELLIAIVIQLFFLNNTFDFELCRDVFFSLFKLAFFRYFIYFLFWMFYHMGKIKYILFFNWLFIINSIIMIFYSLFLILFDYQNYENIYFFIQSTIVLSGLIRFKVNKNLWMFTPIQTPNEFNHKWL